MSIPGLFAVLELLFLTLFLEASGGWLFCYVDLEGIKRPDDDKPVDVSKFRTQNCSFYSIGKVEKPCMTRTDRNDIVTRSCATIPKTEEGCEDDGRGALLCYCLTSYCNDAVSHNSFKSKFWWLTGTLIARRYLT